MKKLKLLILLSLLSLVIMLLVDILLGAHAEFLTAWSVRQRIVGHISDAGESLIYKTMGAPGEFYSVLLVYLVIGIILTLLCRPWLR